ncbi:hypothetical protein C8J56DRAFT_311643 [Mycena floridula]|nr:hypothetical protein C8J56DRAFT_311643 [Mycena floridula]
MQQTLRHFILKQKVFDLYRLTIRASRVLPDPQVRRETLAWIRVEFERNRHLTDPDVIQEKISLGRREIMEILPINAIPSPSSQKTR